MQYTIETVILEPAHRVVLCSTTQGMRIVINIEIMQYGLNCIDGGSSDLDPNCVRTLLDNHPMNAARVLSLL